jgi:hypothetical protein
LGQDLALVTNSDFSDFHVYNLLCDSLALLVGGFLFLYVLSRLKRSRPELAIGKPMAAAFILRFLGASGIGSFSISLELRGPDERGFFARAHDLAANYGLFSDASTDTLTTKLHIFMVSLNDRLLNPAPGMVSRLEFICLGLVGLALMATAVYELAGPKAATIAAWVVALEPANVFFSGVVHKEPLMFLSEGLLAYGGAKMWKRGELSAVMPLVLGCLIAIATRPYVGWFFVAAAAAVSLHASLRRLDGDRSLAFLAVGVMAFAIFVPIALQKSSDKELEGVQQSQDANAEDQNANLVLERVDYSTREKVILNLPTRIRDVVFKPYPWQVENRSQQLGVLGTLVLFVGLFLLMVALLQNGGELLRRAGPLVYPALFALVAYSLSAGNAGTAYRYRTHVVGLMLCVLVVLREQRAQEHARRAEISRAGRLQAVPAPGGAS